MLFYKEIVNHGDRVFDISVNRGYGKVIRVLDDKIEVKFSRYSIYYNAEGIQQSKEYPTLYWDKPLIIAPHKEEYNWSIKRKLVNDFFNLIADAKEII